MFALLIQRLLGERTQPFNGRCQCIPVSKVVGFQGRCQAVAVGHAQRNGAGLNDTGFLVFDGAAGKILQGFAHVVTECRELLGFEFKVQR